MTHFILVILVFHARTLVTDDTGRIWIMHWKLCTMCDGALLVRFDDEGYERLSNAS